MALNTWLVCLRNKTVALADHPPTAVRRREPQVGLGVRQNRTGELAGSVKGVHMGLSLILRKRGISKDGAKDVTFGWPHCCRLGEGLAAF